MQKPGLFAAFFGVVALALLPSCQDEDFGFTTDEIRQEVYNRNFKEIFGDVDPDHNWSMAQNVKVNINVPGARGYQVRVLTEAPTNREAIVLYCGEMSSDQLSVNVDVVRGSHNLYVELKSDFGIFLVDGYYQIDEEGNVEINKGVTRAAGDAPGCSVYTTTLHRWKREWSDSEMAKANPYQWDKGFVSLDNHLTTNSTSECTFTTTTKEISISNSKAYICGIEKTLEKCVLFTNNNAPSVVTFSNLPKFPINGMYVHIPLAVYSGNKDAKFSITLAKADGTDERKIENIGVPEENLYKGTDGIVFFDATMGWQGNLDTNANYTLKVQLNGNNSYFAVCGGYSLQMGWSQYTFDEQITNGQVRYTDVRGGSLSRYDDLQLRDADTYRNGPGNQYFHYRTYDVTKLKQPSSQLGFMSTFYIVNGENGDNIKVGSESIKYSDMFPLFGLYKSTTTGQWKGSPFREGDNHIDDYFTDGDYNAQTTYNMKHDAQIVTLGSINSGEVQYDGSVSVKLVGFGTNWANDIGYFYYPKDANVYIEINGEKVLDFNKIPKVIIRKDMQGAINGQKPDNLLSSDNLGGSERLWMSNFREYVDGCYALSLQEDELSELLALPQFDNYKEGNNVKTFIDGLRSDVTKRKKAADATFEAPIYKLPYYGWQETSGKFLPTGTPQYEWPKDMVIGFFGIRTDNVVAAELARIYTSSASVERNYFNDLPRGSAFSYKGKNYIGLEDEWDYDNNDFLFEVFGVQSVDPDITPEDDIVDTKTTQDWLVACEDLGGVWDYDFNDLVWAITKEVNTTKTTKYDGTTTEVGTTDIYFTPLAAGGTLDARVEYNTSIALSPDHPGWNNNAWITLGEIHQMVTRDTNAPTDVQVNVDPADTWNITKERIGQRVKLGTTIPTNDQAISIESILKHFRIRVKHNDGEYVVANVHESLPDGENHNHEHGGSLNYGNGKSHAPQFILLPKGWAWPAEGVCITEVYGLQNWFQNQNETGWLDTWRNTNEGKNGEYIISPI